LFAWPLSIDSYAPATLLARNSDPAVVAELDLVRWELSVCCELGSNTACQMNHKI
jgi:hypothetical protein